FLEMISERRSRGGTDSRPRLSVSAKPCDLTTGIRGRLSVPPLACPWASMQDRFLPAAVLVRPVDEGRPGLGGRFWVRGTSRPGDRGRRRPHGTTTQLIPHLTPELLLDRAEGREDLGIDPHPGLGGEGIPGQGDGTARPVGVEHPAILD